MLLAHALHKQAHRVRDSDVNKAVHYSWAQLVHHLDHGFVIVLEGDKIYF